jgi:uncharacterized protein
MLVLKMTGDTLLIGTLTALGLGPAVARVARQQPPLLTFIDGFVLVCIGGLVLLDVVPHALEHGDLLALVFIVAGYALPGMAERLLTFGVRQTHLIVMVLAMLGITVHSLLDGSALAQSGALSGSLLGYGVLLHQLPVSLMVWWVLSDRHPVVPWTVLALMGGAIVVGYAAETSVFAALPERAARLFEALVGGSLLHVIAHPAHDHDPSHEHAPGHPHLHGASGHGHTHGHAHEHAHRHDHGATPAHTHSTAAEPPARGWMRWANGMGALAGAAMLVVLLVMRREGANLPTFGSVLATFWSLCLDSAPAVLLAYLTAGVVYGFLPTGGMAWISRGSRLRQGVAGMAVGLPLPICSCGVVPLYQQLVQQGASTTAAVAFLIATPELGIDAILLSVPLLGTEFAFIRVAAAAIAAIAVAVFMGGMVKRKRPSLPLFGQTPAAVSGTRDKLAQAARKGLSDMVDHTAPWILAGLAVAAFAMPVLEGSWLTTLPRGVDVLAFALIGMPLYICASASTPLVAVLVAAGVSPGAGLALLLTGPATNVATLGILTRLHGRRFAWPFAGSMALMAVLLGIVVNLLWPTLPAMQPAIGGLEPATPLQLLSVLLVAALYAASVLRRGVRGFLGELRFEMSTS